jgi:hypothetical protein
LFFTKGAYQAPFLIIRKSGKKVSKGGQIPHRGRLSPRRAGIIQTQAFTRSKRYVAAAIRIGYPKRLGIAALIRQSLCLQPSK